MSKWNQEAEDNIARPISRIAEAFDVIKRATAEAKNAVNDGAMKWNMTRAEIIAAADWGAMWGDEDNGQFQAIFAEIIGAIPEGTA